MPDSKKAPTEVPWKPLVILLLGIMTGGGAGTFALTATPVGSAFREDGSASAELTLVMADAVAEAMVEHESSPHNGSVGRVEFEELKKDTGSIKRMMRKLCRAQFPMDRECDDL